MSSAIITHRLIGWKEKLSSSKKEVADVENLNINEWVDTRQVKARLNRYREKDRDIDNEIERLEWLEAKLYNVGSPQISDLPKGTPSKDRKESMIDKKDTLSNRIMDMIKEQEKERVWIEGILASFYKSDEKAVIRMRYIDGCKWNEVTEMLFGNEEDYDDKRESYLRRTTKLHERALINMARIIKAGETEPLQKAL